MRSAGRAREICDVNIYLTRGSSREAQALYIRKNKDLCTHGAQLALAPLLSLGANLYSDYFCPFKSLQCLGVLFIYLCPAHANSSLEGFLVRWALFAFGMQYGVFLETAFLRTCKFIRKSN